VVRRAPFSDNPNVGARGQRTQQRILDAALRVFGEVGYHRCSIDTITRMAGCSRVSFYQYFSSKEDVFRHLAGLVARQLDASTERLDPITPDRSGWAAARAWVERYGEIYERYEPVFHAFAAAAESDVGLLMDSVGTATRSSSAIRARVEGATLRPSDLDPVIQLLGASLTRTLDHSAVLHHAMGDALPLPAILDAFTDVVHRTLFGLVPHANVRVGPPSSPQPPRLPFGPVMRAALDRGADASAGSAGGPAPAALLEAGRRVFVARGLHGTRVDNIVDAAGLSHGTFYRYFRSKEELALLLAVGAMHTVSTTFTDMPDLTDAGATGRTSLRRWLRAYNRAQMDETAMIRVWADAALQDSRLRDDSASVTDWGRRRLANALRFRDFGDPDVDAVVLLSVIDAFGVHLRTPLLVNAAVLIIERGFLGR
jgi:AcrR family transcriptional regulator